MGSIESTVTPTPAQAAVTIQRWFHHHHHNPANYAKDKSVIMAVQSKSAINRLKRRSCQITKLQFLEESKSTLKELRELITQSITKHTMMDTTVNDLATSVHELTSKRQHTIIKPRPLDTG